MTSILFIIEPDLSNQEVLLNNILEGIDIHIGYDISENIISQYDRVAFIYHENHYFPFMLDNKNNIDLYFGIEWIDYFKNNTQIIDLLSCNFPFYLHEHIVKNEVSIILNYSDDVTGNEPIGNWILEKSINGMNDINIRDIYFKEGITEWDVHLQNSNGTLVVDASGEVWVTGEYGDQFYGSFGTNYGEGFADILYFTNQKSMGYAGVNYYDGKKVLKIFSDGLRNFALTANGDIYYFGGRSMLVYDPILGPANKHYPHLVSRQHFNNNDIKQVAIGSLHVLFLDVQGNVYCANHNVPGTYMYGETGLGDNTSHSSPQQLDSSYWNNRKIVKIATGDYHSIILDEYGDVYTFGRNTYGQLGIAVNDTSNRLVPTKINDDLIESKIIDIAAGSWSCYLVDLCGNAYSFGRNFYNQLGQGNIHLGSHPNNPYYNGTTLWIAAKMDNVNYNGKNIVAVESHSFATHTRLILDSCGNVYSFGYGGIYGGLGLGTPIGTADGVISPTKITTNISSKTIVKITTGEYSCLIDSDYNLYTFGHNRWGQLGLGTTISKNVPTLVNSSAFRTSYQGSFTTVDISNVHDSKSRDIETELIINPVDNTNGSYILGPGVYLKNLVIDDISLTTVELKDVTFENVLFDNVTIIGDNLENVDFINCKFENINISVNKLINNQYIENDYCDFTFESLEFVNTTISDEILEELNIVECNLCGLTLQTIEISGSLFKENEYCDFTFESLKFVNTTISDEILEELNIVKCNLCGLTLQTIEISGSLFKENDYCDFTFESLEFVNTTISDEILKELTFFEISLCTLSLDVVSINNCTFINVDFCGFEFNNIVITNTTISNETIEGLVVTDSDVTELTLQSPEINESMFYNNTNNGFIIYGASFTNTTISYEEIDGLTITNSNLSGLYINANIIVNSDFTNSNMQGYNFEGMNIKDTLLIGVILIDSNLSNSILNNVNLTNADITGSNVSGSDFGGINLSNTIIDGDNVSESGMFTFGPFAVLPLSLPENFKFEGDAIINILRPQTVEVDINVFDIRDIDKPLELNNNNLHVFDIENISINELISNFYSGTNYFFRIRGANNNPLLSLYNKKINGNNVDILSIVMDKYENMLNCDMDPYSKIKITKQISKYKHMSELCNSTINYTLEDFVSEILRQQSKTEQYYLKDTHHIVSIIVRIKNEDILVDDIYLKFRYKVLFTESEGLTRTQNILNKLISQKQ